MSTHKTQSPGPSLSLDQVCASNISSNFSNSIYYLLVAAGLRCTLANTSYTSRELAFQYTDSSAKLIFTSEQGLPTVRQTFHELGFSKEEGDRRIVVLPQSLQWAGGPDAPRRSEANGLLELGDLLGKGTLQMEERFDGKDAYETVYLCYSSGMHFHQDTPILDETFF